MHRYLLKEEMGRWYRRDIILPIIIVGAIGLIAREILPEDSSKIIILLGVFSTFAFSFVAASLSAGHLNIMQFVRLLKTKHWDK